MVPKTTALAYRMLYVLEKKIQHRSVSVDEISFCLMNQDCDIKLFVCSTCSLKPVLFFPVATEPILDDADFNCLRREMNV